MVAASGCSRCRIRVYGQNKSQYLGALLTPGTFTSSEMEALRRKYRRIHKIGLSAAIALTVIRTVVWGYGDFFVKAVEQIH